MPNDLRDLMARFTGHDSPVRRSFVEDLDEPSLWAQHRLSLGQINELLLSLAYDTISDGFFAAFLQAHATDPKGLDGEDFRRAIEHFEKLALLKYGNVKFAFKRLGQLDSTQIDAELADLKPIDANIYSRRPLPLRVIEALLPHETHYLGHVTGGYIEQSTREDLKAELTRCRLIGEHNLNVYLASDEMDVYVATSMRDVEDFYFVAYAVKQLFAKDALTSLNLRYFDPTQAYCAPRIEKGLVESLMLRRAKCTVYCAQTTETLGKDSELAVTLAQGKPVVVYAPKIKANEADSRRLCHEAATIHTRLHEATVADYYRMKLVERHAKTLGREIVHLFEWDESTLLDRLIVLDDALFERKATLLKEQHPLGIQVDLRTGVANGVLVARTLTECAELVRAVLTNSLTFHIKRLPNGTRELVENRTGCTYRLMVGDPIITNSFWNFYRPWIRDS